MVPKAFASHVKRGARIGRTVFEKVVINQIRTLRESPDLLKTNRLTRPMCKSLGLALLLRAKQVLASKRAVLNGEAVAAGDCVRLVDNTLAFLELVAQRSDDDAMLVVLKHCARVASAPPSVSQWAIGSALSIADGRTCGCF